MNPNHFHEVDMLMHNDRYVCACLVLMRFLTALRHAKAEAIVVV